SVSDHEVFERNGCRVRARFHLFRNEAKGFRRPFLGEDTHRKYYILDFFVSLELEQHEREKAEYCVKRRFRELRFLIERKFCSRSLQWIMPESGIGMDMPERFIGVSTVNSFAAGSIVKEKIIIECMQSTIT
ncbi:hypothetical protein TNCT_518801, partial [Trichonephila clavata]